MLCQDLPACFNSLTCILAPHSGVNILQYWIPIFGENNLQLLSSNLLWWSAQDHLVAVVLDRLDSCAVQQVMIWAWLRCSLELHFYSFLTSWAVTIWLPMLFTKTSSPSQPWCLICSHYCGLGRFLPCWSVSQQGGFPILGRYQQPCCRQAGSHVVWADQSGFCCCW